MNNILSANQYQLIFVIYTAFAYYFKKVVKDVQKTVATCFPVYTSIPFPLWCGKAITKSNKAGRTIRHTQSMLRHFRDVV